ncbi:MAG TPA: penicillin-binding protein 2 [Gemmatimonadales bacterium]|jgi:penicillin-binding protein 2|nr:penicillin-binding protein 2 [Gemmatimonadales bacterium]
MREINPQRLRNRAAAARWIVVGAFGLLAVAFFRTQILQHERFRLQAAYNRLRPVPLAAARGSIYDREGRIIAETVPGYSVALLASNEDSLRQTLRRLAKWVPVDSGIVDAVIERFRQARYQPAVVISNAGFTEVSKLEEHRLDLPGLVIQSEPRRVYPDGKAVAHLVGYLGEVTQADLDADRFPGSRLGTLVGRAGLEAQYDDSLRGAPGIRYIEVDARGRLVREEGAAPPLPPIAGRQLITTIDLPLQRYIDSIWPGGIRGAMVAMSPKGEIRAFYSTPAYDPNAFIGGISGADWKALNQNPALPLLNRALQVRYPPASPFKLAVATMALRRGLVGFGSHMPEPCRGGLQYGNRYFRCWKQDGHGSLDLTGAIANSCDVYFYQLGLRLGLTAILQDGVLLGFKEKSGIDLGSEVNPIYPGSTAYYDKVYGARNWSSAVTLNLSIGQGENTQTLMNMMRFYEALAGDGTSTTPYLVRPGRSPKRDLGLTDVQLGGIRNALIAVVERGTAAASRQTDLSIAGKTGTAQNPHGQDHGWFIGFAPADHPEIIIGGIMEFAKHGTFVAPYVVRAIRRYVLGPVGDLKNSQIKVLGPEDSVTSSSEVIEEPEVPDTAANTVSDSVP